MKSIVVYSSISGFTKRYAEWISEELDADCVSIHSVDSKKLSQYDVVVFGSHVQNGDITHRKQFAELAKSLNRVIVFVVGGSPAGHNPVLRMIFKKIHRSIPQSVSAPEFYFQGGMNLEALPEEEMVRLNKTLRMMKILSVVIFPARKIFLNIVDMMSHNSDNTSKESIVPLVEFIKGHE